MGQVNSAPKEQHDSEVREEDEEEEYSKGKYTKGDKEEQQSFRINLARTMLPSSTTILSENQNYDLSTLNNQVNSGIVQQILNGVIVVLCFEESWTQNGASSLNRKDFLHGSLDEEEEEALENLTVYGAYDNDLLTPPVTVITETVGTYKREQKVEQKEEFHDIDIDFISRIDCFSNFGVQICSIKSQAYQEVENYLAKEKSKKKKKSNEPPAPPTPPPVFNNSKNNNSNSTKNTSSLPESNSTNNLQNTPTSNQNGPGPTTHSNSETSNLSPSGPVNTSNTAVDSNNSVQSNTSSSLHNNPNATESIAPPRGSFSTNPVSSNIFNVFGNTIQDIFNAGSRDKKPVSAALSTKSEVKMNGQIPLEKLLVERRGLQYDPRKRAVSFTGENPPNTSLNAEDDDFGSFVFSKNGRYEKIEIDFAEMSKFHIVYLLFYVKFPFSQSQLKTTVHYTKLNKKSSGGATQRKVIQKKIPKSTRLLAKVYDRLTKVELCRFNTQLDTQFLYNNSGEDDELVGLLYFNQEEQKWLFRASNFFRPIPPNKLIIQILEGQELMSFNTEGKSDPYVIVEYPENKQVYKTKIVKKTLDPVWGEKCEIVFSKEKPFRPEDRLVLKMYDWDMIGKHEILGTLRFNILELFTFDNSTFHKQRITTKSGTKCIPMVTHDTEWFYLDTEGRIRINFSLHWD